MTDEYEYFVKVTPGQTVERPSSMWRRSGADWQYLSLLDWNWHSLVPGKSPYPPVAGYLVPISAQQAEELGRDRQRFVSYWAYYSVARDRRPEPLTVLRRRRSPELVLDEAFTRDLEWAKTPSIVEFEHPAASNPPDLEEIDADTAEEILQEAWGVSGATQL
jgi:hypothetical protein